MEILKKNLKSITVAALLLLGLVAGLYLVQHPQILRSRAASDLGNVLNVSTHNGKVEYQGNNTWKTNSSSINIGISDLEQLK